MPCPNPTGTLRCRRCALNSKVLRPVSKELQRHPYKTLRVSLFALRHRKGLLAVKHVTEHASRIGATTRRVARDRRVRRETRLALSAVALANKRARKIGLAHTLGDRQVATHLRHAGDHASKAMTFAERARHGRRIGRTTTIIVVGTGALGGAAYAGWKVYGQPQPPAASSPPPETAQPSVDGEPPAAA
jgi:hypothetical protein